MSEYTLEKPSVITTKKHKMVIKLSKKIYRVYKTILKYYRSLQKET